MSRMRRIFARLNRFLNPVSDNQELVLILTVVRVLIALAIGGVILIQHRMEAADPNPRADRYNH
jgi:hypothetical protein